jgi:YfiH family protein
MSVPVITSERLANAHGVSHAFFTREGGVSDGVYATLNGGRGSDDDPAKVAENRRRMTAALGVADGQLATPYQIHSANVVTAVEPWAKGEAPHADGLVTSTKGLALGISTADCGPVLFADPGEGVIGAAHAGWRGALAGVLDATVDAMEKLGARRDSIITVLGPCLRQPSYEVGPEFVAEFGKADRDNVRFFKTAGTDGKSLFDLGGYIVHRLRETGVGQIEDLGFDTYADEARFFSFRRTTHRKEADYGRLIAAIALR